jgi:fatty-acyl-CoA synthase
MKLYDKFICASLKYALKPAFTFLNSDLKCKTYTYGELFDKVELVANNLRKLNLKNTLVGLLMSSQEDQIIHYLASLSCDLVPAILTPYNRKLNREYYIKTMEKVIGNCSFSVIITDVLDLKLDIPIISPYSISNINDGVLISNYVDAVFLQFSSGTTGIKRGVLVSDEAVLEQLRIYSNVIGLSHNDCIVSWLPLYHDMGFIACLNMPLVYGVHTVVIHPIDWVSDPSLYIKALSTFRGTLGWNPNFAYAFMADRVKDDLQVDLSSVRKLFNCSEPVTRESQTKFISKFSSKNLKPNVFCGCYAMAETTFAVTYGESTDPGYYDNCSIMSSCNHVSVGRALPNTEIKLVDGEFWIKSPFNAFGYFNNPEASMNAFTDGWYKTGDLGYKVGDEFFVCGRKKDLIIISGVNFYPNDLEDALNDVSGIIPGRVVAFSVYDSNLQTERAVILAETSLEDYTIVLIEARKRLLSSFQISNFVINMVPVGWLIKSSAGKIARSANKEKWLNV